MRSRRVRAIVPASVTGLVTARVLVMDFCEGFAIKDAARLDAAGVGASSYYHPE